MARALLDEALAAAQRVEDEESRPYALLHVAEVMAKTDPDGALDAARSIEKGHRPRALALLQVARRLEERDPARARSVALEALEAAASIEDDEDRAGELRGVASLLAKLDLDKALEVARGIESGLGRSEALAGVGAALADTKPKQSEMLFDEALALARSLEADRWEALQYISVSLAPIDADRAVDVAQSIGDERLWRGRALSDIVWALADDDPDKAVAVAEKIGMDEWRGHALFRVAGGMAKKDPARALKIARTVPAGDAAYWRAVSLGAAVGGLAKTSPAEARSAALEAVRLARGLGEGRMRARALAVTAEALARTDLEEGLEAARSVGDVSERAHSLALIGWDLARMDPKKSLEVMDEAVTVARSIEDAGKRDIALMVIAWRLAVTDPDKAREIARSIGDERTRAQALAKAASAYLRGDALR